MRWAKAADVLNTNVVSRNANTPRWFPITPAPQTAMRRSWDNNRIARLELDILGEVLTADDVFVVELVTDRFAVFVPHDDDVLAIGIIPESASHRDQLEHSRRT